MTGCYNVLACRGPVLVPHFAGGLLDRYPVAEVIAWAIISAGCVALSMICSLWPALAWVNVPAGLPGVNTSAGPAGAITLSKCAECSEHYPLLLNTCFHSCEQVRNDRGEWVSKVLACPHFRKAPEFMSYKEFAELRGYA